MDSTNTTGGNGEAVATSVGLPGGDYHGQTMNLPCAVDVPGDLTWSEKQLAIYAYKRGHKAARHAAAELVVQADARLDALRAAMVKARGYLRDMTDPEGNSENAWITLGNALVADRKATDEPGNRSKPCEPAMAKKDTTIKKERTGHGRFAGARGCAPSAHVLLRACPFCGGKMEVRGVPGRELWGAECQYEGCRALGPIHSDPHRAWLFANRRRFYSDPPTGAHCHKAR